MLLIGFCMAVNYLFAQSPNFIQLFENCEQDSLFIEKNGHNEYEVFQLSKDDLGNTSDPAMQRVFNADVKEVTGPFRHGEADVWYKTIKVNLDSKNERNSVKYIKLVRNKTYSIAFPGEPDQGFENMPILGLGEVLMEANGFEDSLGIYLVMFFEVDRTEMISNYSHEEKAGFLDGILSYFIMDLGISEDLIAFRNIEDENGILREFSMAIQNKKIIMRGLFTEKTVYLILCGSDEKGADEFVGSFRLN